MIERLSIELSSVCSKACWFCYSSSTPAGDSHWTPDDVVAFVRDCAKSTVRAVSFGGGEPLEYPGVFDVLEALRGTLFRSLTTNGLLLEGSMLDQLVRAAPDKVHVSVHFPERVSEVERVAAQVEELRARGIRSGVNLLVRRSRIAAARAATEILAARGVESDRIVFLPMRGQDAPSPRQVAEAAGSPRFQSMTCLSACAKSERFAAVAWNRTVAWCSYTTARAPLDHLTYDALMRALDGLGLTHCGDSDDGAQRLVRLSRRPLDGHDVVRSRP